MCLLLTDLHLGLRNEDPNFLELSKILHEEILTYCFYNDIETIYNLGDFFHNRNSIGLKTMQTAKEIADMIEEYEHINYYIILGNHDIHYKNQLYPNSLIPLFEKYKNIHIIDRPTVHGNTTLVPWNTDPKELEPNEILLGHYEINHFPMNENIDCFNSKFNISDFFHFKQVFTGHFHTPSKKENITYIGSVFQQTFNDVNSLRGYYILTKTDLEFIEFKQAPKFIKLFTNDINHDIISGNIVKLIFVEDYGNLNNNKIIEDVNSKNPLKLITDFSNIEFETTEEKREENIKDNKLLLHEFIDKTDVPKNINKNTLFAIIKNISEDII